MRTLFPCLAVLSLASVAAVQAQSPAPAPAASVVINEPVAPVAVPAAAPAHPSLPVRLERRVAAERRRLTVAGTLSLQSPVYTSQGGGPTVQSTEIVGHLEIQNVLPRSPLNLVFNMNRALAGWKNPRYDFDNKLQAGVEYPLSEKMTMYSYWDRQPARGADRVWVGVRMAFKSR